jgi:uncharacterized protein YjbI with pentapeptide repeats
MSGDKSNTISVDDNVDESAKDAVADATDDDPRARLSPPRPWLSFVLAILVWSFLPILLDPRFVRVAMAVDAKQFPPLLTWLAFAYLLPAALSVAAPLGLFTSLLVSRQASPDTPRSSVRYLLPLVAVGLGITVSGLLLYPEANHRFRVLADSIVDATTAAQALTPLADVRRGYNELGFLAALREIRLAWDPSFTALLVYSLGVRVMCLFACPLLAFTGARVGDKTRLNTFGRLALALTIGVAFSLTLDLGHQAARLALMPVAIEALLPTIFLGGIAGALIVASRLTWWETATSHAPWLTRAVNPLIALVYLAILLLSVREGPLGPISGLSVVITLAAVSAVWAIVQLPRWATESLKDYERVKGEDEVRRTMVQLCGGIFLVMGVYGTWTQIENSTRALEVNSRASSFDRFVRGSDALANATTTERQMAALFALGQLAHDSPRDQWDIMVLVASYLRGRTTPAARSAPQASREVVEAALTVIMNRDEKKDLVKGDEPDHQFLPRSTTGKMLNLSGVDVRGINVRGRSLTRVNFSGANLSDATMKFGGLHEVDFTGADLKGVVLEKTDHSDAHSVNFAGGNLSGAELIGRFARASFVNADLGGARLNGEFDYVRFAGARLQRANAQNSRFDGGLMSATLELTNVFGVRGLSSDAMKSLMGRGAVSCEVATIAVLVDGDREIQYPGREGEVLAESDLVRARAVARELCPVLKDLAADQDLDRLMSAWCRGKDLRKIRLIASVK